MMHPTTRVIRRYTLTTQRYQELILPKGAELLSVQLYKRKPTAWVLLQEDETLTEPIRILAYGLDSPYVSTLDLKYLASLHENDFVIHYFQLIE